MSERITLTLRVPVDVDGDKVGTVTELRFRAPIGRDIARCGIPANAAGDINTEVVHRYIWTLADEPPTVADRLGPEDWLEAMKIVAGFFVPAAPAPSTPSSMSPAGGATSTT